MDDKDYRTLVSFGKRQGFIALSESIKRDFDVSIPPVDDRQVDRITKKGVNGKDVYLDIQTNARPKDCKPYVAARFAAMRISPRGSYFSFLLGTTGYILDNSIKKSLSVR